MESNPSNLDRAVGLAGLLMLGGFALPWFTLDMLWETVSVSPLVFLTKGELVALVPLVGAVFVVIAAVHVRRRKLLGYLGLSAVPALLVYAGVRTWLAVADSGMGSFISGDMVAEAGGWLLERGRIGLWLSLAGHVIGLIAVRRSASGEYWEDTVGFEDFEDEPSELLAPLPVVSAQ